MKENKKISKEFIELIQTIQFTENVSSSICGIYDEKKIFKIIKDEFTKSKKYSMSILLFSEDKSKLRIAHSALSVDKKTVEKGERSTGLKLINYSIDLKKSSLYSKAAKQGQTIQTKVSEIIKELFPQPLALFISKLFGYENRYCILTPLFLFGEIIGVLAISSLTLYEYLIPSVKNLANHISAAISLCAEFKKNKMDEQKIRNLNSAVEQSIDGIAMSNMEPTIVYVNKAFANLFGYTTEELIGMSLDMLHAKKQPVFYKEGMQTLMKKGSWEGEIIHHHNNGTVFHTYTSVTLLLDSKDMATGLLCIVKDISNYKKAEQEIINTTQKLAEQKKELEKKNITLREILAQLETEKKEIKANIIDNIEILIDPFINKLKTQNLDHEQRQKYLYLIQKNLMDITSPFIANTRTYRINLSPREVEICNMIKNGFSNKEIANILFISLLTVERHRYNIRQKLGITNKQINLRAYLQEL